MAHCGRKKWRETGRYQDGRPTRILLNCVHFRRDVRTMKELSPAGMVSLSFYFISPYLFFVSFEKTAKIACPKPVRFYVSFVRAVRRTIGANFYVVSFINYFRTSS